MFINVQKSLADILGKAYVEKVAEAAHLLHGIPREQALAIACEKVDFYPREYADAADSFIDKIGTRLLKPFENTNAGAPTEPFKPVTNREAAPLGGLGCLRVGEGGYLYFSARSEHYHASLGFGFPGYRLVENARRLGIPNMTHNNTRGYITRLCELALVKEINGTDSEAELEAILASKEPRVLNRVINLQTGSIAVEAGVKMMLTRFYRLDKTKGAPKYAGKTPVFFIMADNEGGPEANYHGTTVVAQTFRGVWPELYAKLEAAGVYKVVPVKKNDIGDFRAKMDVYNQGNYKTAGFLHEIVLMNYGGVKLEKAYLQEAYKLCRAGDTPTMVDEIQSCMWCKEIFLFKHYALSPDFVIIGKGFAGGEYATSRIITTYEMDSLNQFGALVTNGQEELAGLVYLITMGFVKANGRAVAETSAFLDSAFARLSGAYPGLITSAEGWGHLPALHFNTVEQAAVFAQQMKAQCIDVTPQSHKAGCPPAVLFKPPVVTSRALAEFLVSKVEGILQGMYSVG